MPTKPRPEDRLITLFVSAYENDSWKDANLKFPDQLQDGGIDGFARRSDGATLAIEHTVVEPFVGDIEDQSEFEPAFLAIENDKSLHVPDIWIRLFVPVGTLHLQKPSVRDAIVSAATDWLRGNRLSLPRGTSEHACRVCGIPGKPDLNLTLTVKVVDLPGEGSLWVRRQQVHDTLGGVIEKTLAKKLPKLVKTLASKRVLLLERQHMNLLPESICGEIEKRIAVFPALADVHEIWIVETMFYERDGYVRFELYENSRLVRSFDFQHDELFTRSEDGMVVSGR